MAWERCASELSTLLFQGCIKSKRTWGGHGLPVLHPADAGPQALVVPCPRQRLSTQIHRERIKPTLLSPGKLNANIARAVRLAQAHRLWDLALAFACPSLVRLQNRAEKRCFWSGSKCVLQSCLNIAQGNRNAEQGSEHSKNNMGLAAHSSASSPSLQPGPRDAGQAEQARAVPEPRNTPGA